MAVPVIAVKVGVALLTNEKTRKAIGWLIVAILSPIIVGCIFLFTYLQGGSKHNADMIHLCFYGGSIPIYTPAEFNEYITDMRGSFGLIDAQISAANAQAEDKMLDSIRVKSLFYSLYFGLETPSRRDHKIFVSCFYTLEERTREVEVPNPDYDPTNPDSTEPETITVEETYEVMIPISSLSAIYEKIASKMGISATAEQKNNAAEIYFRIAGFYDNSPDYDINMEFVGLDGFVSPVGPNWRSMVLGADAEFGNRIDPINGTNDFHRGLDMSGPVGSPIYASLDGVVIAAQYHPSWGQYIKIDHGGGFTTLYAHNSRLLVSVGDRVTAGQQIAQMGATGRVTGSHCHFEVQEGSQLVNPRKYLPS